MPIEGDMVNECADAAIVEVYGVDVCNHNATNSIDDYVVFVTGGGADGEGLLVQDMRNRMELELVEDPSVEGGMLRPRGSPRPRPRPRGRRDGGD